jgi:AcrR family transcriptional regulator
MKSPENRRAAILGHLSDHVLAHGLIASSLRPLAKAAQTSDRMLLYYFADKAEIIAATLDVVAARMVVNMDAIAASKPLPLDQLTRHLTGALITENFWPYMRVWLEIASRAAGGDLFYRRVGAQIGRGFLNWGAAQIKADTEQARSADAARLLVMIEGAVLLHAIGLEDVSRLAQLP